MKTSRIQGFINICCWAVVLICSATFVSCSKDKDSPLHKDRSHRVVLVYMAAENTLGVGHTYDQGDLTEMCAGAADIPAGDRLVIYHDGRSNPVLYELDNKTQARSLDDLKPVKAWKEEMDSATPETLDDVLTFLYHNYPADTYGLVFWSHGCGWLTYDGTPETASRRRPKEWFGVDNNNNIISDNGSRMNMDDMARVLEKYRDIEYILFDACFMQTIEVAYELRNTTSYIIGSPAEIPGQGAPYKSMLPTLFSQTDAAHDIAFAYYDHYYSRDESGVALSVIETARLEEFADVMSDIFSRYDVKDTYTSGLLNYFNFDRFGDAYHMPDFYDIKGLMQRMLTEEDYAVWLAAFNRLVPVSYACDSWFTQYYGRDLPINKQQYGGVSMYLPFEKYSSEAFYNDFANTAWAKRTDIRW